MNSKLDVNLSSPVDWVLVLVLHWMLDSIEHVCVKLRCSKYSRLRAVIGKLHTSESHS